VLPYFTVVQILREFVSAASLCIEIVCTTGVGGVRRCAVLKRGRLVYIESEMSVVRSLTGRAIDMQDCRDTGTRMIRNETN
jgi:hypothetical protein